MFRDMEGSVAALSGYITVDDDDTVKRIRVEMMPDELRSSELRLQ
jgi:hypothetical protein